jgi:hypothetical protein
VPFLFPFLIKNIFLLDTQQIPPVSSTPFVAAFTYFVCCQFLLAS